MPVGSRLLHFANPDLDICAVLIVYDDVTMAIGDLEYLPKPFGDGLGLLVEDDEPTDPPFEPSDN